MILWNTILTVTLHHQIKMGRGSINLKGYIPESLFGCLAPRNLTQDGIELEE